MLGNKILEIALQHVGEQYILGSQAPKNDPNWKGPWDCAEFASWCAYQAYGILFGVMPKGNPSIADAYTGYWDEDAKSNPSLIITPLEASTTAGAFLLRKPVKHGDVKIPGHIVISNGHGGTIEAMDRSHGVVTSKLAGRRWDMGILLPGVTYQGGEGTLQPDFEPNIVLRYTEPMISNPLVTRVQTALQAAGYDPKGIDGLFGPDTAVAVGKFQEAHGIVVDGEVGGITAQLLGISLE
ncbi:MAG: peptidoglycan-binding protein [Magnetococcales bacterium]|nr:peptidoglycan-binding protein [Magnetococcales bacterium]